MAYTAFVWVLGLWSRKTRLRAATGVVIAATVAAIWQEEAWYVVALLSSLTGLLLAALLAEPAHPYDDPDDSTQWVWRLGYFEVLYNPSLKSLALSRGPRGGKHSCRHCHGSGFLPWWERTSQEPADDTSTRCPTCPTRRVFFKYLPLWPVRTLDRLRCRSTRRRTADNHDEFYDTPGPTGGYSNEPPF
ncbi:hypothetical protein [Streptomyces sp. NPDC055140]